MRPSSAVAIAFITLIAGCHFKVVPENADAFQEGLRCSMSTDEAKVWAATNKMGEVSCKSLSTATKKASCETNAGRAVYTLLFDESGGLSSVQPGYIYDLTYLTYDPVIELCEK